MQHTSYPVNMSTEINTAFITKVIKETEEKLSSLVGTNVNILISVPDKEPATGPISRQLQLQRLVCNMYNISWSQLVSKTRKENITLARHVFMYLASYQLNMSKVFIAQLCGGRDHASVCYAVKKIQGYIEIDAKFKEDLAFIEAQLGDL